MTESSTLFLPLSYVPVKLHLASAPSPGILVSTWTRTGISPAQTKGNDNNIQIFGGTDPGNQWSIQCVSGNLNYTSETECTYNANTMFFATGTTGPSGVWCGDFSSYNSISGDWTFTQCTDWIWFAWQVIVSATDVTIRQWAKFNTTGAVFIAGSSTVTFTTLRATMKATLINDYSYTNPQATTISNSWVPSTTITAFEIGADGDWTGSDFLGISMYHVRLESTSSNPTLSYLETLSKLYSADTTAWADYQLNWLGSVKLTDRSGNGRDLTADAGAFYAGQTAPNLAPPAPPASAAKTENNFVFFGSNF